MSHEVMSLQLSERTGATPVTERSLAPDLARGFMLLWIALANSLHYGWLDRNGVLGGFPRRLLPRCRGHLVHLYLR